MKDPIVPACPSPSPRRALSPSLGGAQRDLVARSERGVALVVTLIMLSVITFLTIAFLAVSRRDRASVTTSLNQTDSRFMADTALERFKGELVARVMARSNLYDYDVMLTRNFVNPEGYVDRGDLSDTNNVNYDYLQNGSPLGQDDRQRMIANLFYDPRPPVFVRDNAGVTDFRFYLDLNRNGRFETNGLVGVQDENGTFLRDNSGNVLSNDFLGEPEWIGVLQNPELPHGPNNRFVGRYLYLALPISKTLDLNHIHNYAKGNLDRPANMNSGDGFLRHQGFGSWELNLASFLVDLNTNVYVSTANTLYDYLADTSSGSAANRGDAFNDALSFLRYRYANNFGNLRSVANLFPGNGNNAFNGALAFRTDFIDGYATRPALTAPYVSLLQDPDDNPNQTGKPWHGANNVNEFLTPQDVFDPNKTSQNFVDKLQRVSTNNNTYDRYTFSRLLESIGTGSAPEVRRKININYVNNPTLNTVSTNFVEWQPLPFFTNVVDRLIQDNLVTQFVSPGETNYYMFNTNDPANRVRPEFSYNNIQIFPTNEYTAPVHRLFQVAANIYDATRTNRFPTIFRPFFGLSGGTTNIAGFAAETNSLFITNSIADGMQARSEIRNLNGFVWGVPLVVGAKKGFPAFNKFVLQNSAQISRTLQIRKTDTSDNPVFTQTNQAIMLGLSNSFGIELWNSYTNVYTRNLRVIVTNQFIIALTNEFGQIIWPPTGVPFTNAVSTNFVTNMWAPAPFANAFVFPIGTNRLHFMTNAQYSFNSKRFFPGSGTFETGVGYPNPAWGLAMTNRLVCMIIDISDGPDQHVVDFVNLDNMTASLNLTRALLGNELSPAGPAAANSPVQQVWNTNRVGRSSDENVPTLGMLQQIDLSMGSPALTDADWSSYSIPGPVGPQKDRAIAAFTRFMGFTPAPPYHTMPMPPYTVAQAPFSPARKLDQTIKWEANDPLVHFTVRDLVDGTNPPVINLRIPPNNPAPSMGFGRLNTRYRPWGGNHPPTQNGADNDDGLNYDFRVKDPGVRWSDDWSFPTNKFPNLGWLGRVHRGTPWQTIYMKGGSITNIAWFRWAGHYQSNPTNDWKLFDVFTTAPNDNAASGLVSVNQSNLTAWSAVFGGMIVLSNSMTDAQAFDSQRGTPTFESHLIQPNSPALRAIVDDINNTRTRQFGGTFQSMGEILAVPSLSTAFVETNNTTFTSPFLTVLRSPAQRRHAVTDDVYERIPQQLMSLVKLGEPRFVIYSYGQSLRPANQSLVLDPVDSRLRNLVTNYQITGEVSTRTIMRVEGNPNNPRAVIESYNVLPGE